MDVVTVKRALVSVTDKTGIVEFCAALSREFGVEIVSTGGTAAVLAEAGIPVRPIDEITGFPEMMDGRVKTLHPKVHGGLLARRDSAEHMAQAAEHGIGMIDMVVVNLYAFEATVAREGVTLEEAVENIDIGGPSMLRSAAKNFDAVTVVTDPATYEEVLAEMRANGGGTTLATRRRLAAEVFRLTSAYDSAIWMYLSGYGKARFPEEVRFRLLKVQDLRYGENPHQDAAFYRFIDAKEHTLARAEQLQGKELSYNNILDTDACWAAVREFDAPACVIVKHTNPCGVAVASDLATAYRKAYECDHVSAYGGVMAFNGTLTAEVVSAVFENKHFVEVVVAPDYDPEALAMLDEKRKIRVLRTGGIRPLGGHYESRAVEGGMLVQTSDAVDEDPSRFRVVTIQKPTDAEMEQLLFAWKVAKSVKSNAIVLARDFAAVGIGAGQMNRVNSARIAVAAAGDKARGSVCASDAFMPFPDSLEVVVEAGATAVIQPGGSIRDDEVIARANRYGIAMVFTGYRHFRH
jgi:phosphoribosylaminoimidazolecarboxamide formyltransferase/IMP cyclohydrolase